MESEQTRQVLVFKHGSRAVLLVGGILLAGGVGLIYTAITNAKSSAGTSFYHFSMGIILLLTGAKLAFGLERNEFNLSARRWRSSRGLFKRKAEKGTFDDLDAVLFDHRQRRHGIQYYDSYHVGVSRSSGEVLHIEQTTSREYAEALARELAMRLGIEVEELSDGASEEPGGEPDEE